MRALLRLLRPRRCEPADRAAYDVWARARRREFGWRGGLKLWTWSPPQGESLPDGTLTIAARHWPHLLCWSWFVQWVPYRGLKWDGPRRLLSVYVLDGPRQIGVHTYWGKLLWYNQRENDMVAVGIDRSAVPIVRYADGGRGGGWLGETPEEAAARRGSSSGALRGRL